MNTNETGATLTPEDWGLIRAALLAAAAFSRREGAFRQADEFSAIAEKLEVTTRAADNTERRTT